MVIYGDLSAQNILKGDGVDKHQVSIVTQNTPKLLWGILAFYVVLAFGYSLGPIFEGPDEIEHFRYMQYIADNGQLPPPTGQINGQYHHAPLYYLLNVPFLWILNDTGFDAIETRRNSFYPHDITLVSSDNKNLFLHTRAETTFPYTHSPIAFTVHLLRIIPILFGGLTIWLSYKIASLITESISFRLATIVVVAFHPQFIYLNSVLNNDSLLILLSTASLYGLLFCQKHGFNLKRAILLGLCLGAVLLTKTNGAILAIPVGYLILTRPKSWRYAPIILFFTLSIVGWWWIRNIIVEGDFLLRTAHQITWQSDIIANGTYQFGIALERIPWAYESSIGRFGAGAIPMSENIYNLYVVSITLAIIGCVVTLVRYRNSLNRQLIEQMILVIIFAISWFLILLYLAGVAWQGNQGRYLLPGISIFAIFIVTGLTAWIPKSFKLWIRTFLVGAYGILTASILIFVYQPAYQIDRPPTSIPHPITIEYENTARIIGTDAPLYSVHAGDIVTIPIYWQALNQTNQSLRTYLHTIDANGNPVETAIMRDSYPSTGNLLSTDWDIDEKWADRFMTRIDETTSTQQVYRLIAGIYDANTQQEIPRTNDELPVIAQLAIHSSIREQTSLDYSFGDVIGAQQPRVTLQGSEVELCTYWRALQLMSTDYSQFVHVLDANNELIAQSDRIPLNGAYPTFAWQVDEPIQECILIAVADGAIPYTIAVGFYQLETGERLPLQNSQNEALPNGQIVIPLSN